MSRVKCAVLFLCIVRFFPSAVFAQEHNKVIYFAGSDTLLLFTPIEDNSGFGGKWKLAYDIPRYLASYTRLKFQTGVVNPITVAYFDTAEHITARIRNSAHSLQLYSEEFHSRYIILASVETFSVSRFLVAEQTLAGYEAFAGEIQLQFSIYDAAELRGDREISPFYEGEASGVVKDKGLGITLFGKQTERTNQYFSLDELYFGGDQFNKTIIGEAMLKCAEDFSAKLEKAIPALKTKSSIIPSTLQIDSTGADTSIRLTRRIIRGEIVLVDSDQVFINIGSDESVQLGDILTVFVEGEPILDPATKQVLGTSDARVGEVQIIEVRGTHLSMAAILKGKGAIKVRNKVRALIVR